MKQLMLSILILTILITMPATLQAAQPMRPAELDTINYTQVLFQWPAVSGAESYHLQVAFDLIYDPFLDGLIHDIDVATNAVVVDSDIDWGAGYVWRYWWLDAEGDSIDISFTHRFNTMEYPDSLATVEVEFFGEVEDVQPGLNLFEFSGGFQSALDLDGNVKLLVPGGGESQLLPSGDILCFTGDRGDRYIYRTSLDGDTTFISDQHGGFHHEVDYTYRGTYLTLGRSYEWVMNPEDVPDSLQGDSLLWEGDMIWEFSADGDTVWSWNAHDHFSYDDYELEEVMDAAGGGEHDWTHSNAVHFTPDGNALYLSVRHLSRVTLIDYPSGDVIWNMGKDMPSGDVAFGHDLNLSYQHDPEWQPNGNMLLFDNHNLGPEDSSRALEVSIDLEREPVAEIVYEAWGPRANSQGDADRLPNGNTLTVFGRLAEMIEYNANAEPVWRMAKEQGLIDRRNRIYRSHRIPDLYPLVYTVKGPDNDQHVPANESYIYFAIDNVGHHEQTYRYSVTDSEGWFELEGTINIAPFESADRMVFGMAAADVATDTVTITVYPTRMPSMVDEWTAVIVSDPEMMVDESLRPETWMLMSNYPNPFNSQTVIRFGLPFTERVSLTIYDAQGRLVSTLLSGVVPEGNQRAIWAGVNDKGEPVGSGTYVYVLRTSRGSRSGRITYIR